MNSSSPTDPSAKGVIMNRSQSSDVFEDLDIHSNQEGTRNISLDIPIDLHV